MKRYRVDVDLGDRFWLVHVPDLDRSTQARHLREVEGMARDLVAVMLDVAPDSFDLDIQVATPPAAADHLHRAETLRDSARQAQAAAAAELRKAARALRQEGLPLRDVGQVLGVSYQRAHQLVDDGNPLLQPARLVPEPRRSTTAIPTCGPC